MLFMTMGKSDDDDEYVEYVDGYDDDDVVGDGVMTALVTVMLMSDYFV